MDEGLHYVWLAWSLSVLIWLLLYAEAAWSLRQSRRQPSVGDEPVRTIARLSDSPPPSDA